MTTLQNAEKVLAAIAQGYPVQGRDDRYIVVENPDYQPDNGSDPNLVLDTAVLALFKAAPEVEELAQWHDYCANFFRADKMSTNAERHTETATLLRSQAAQIADLTAELARKNTVIDAYVEMVQSYKDEIARHEARLAVTDEAVERVAIAICAVNWGTEACVKACQHCSAEARAALEAR